MNAGHSIVAFETRKSGRQVAMLGMIDVGEIVLDRPGGFYWQLWLPFCSQMGRAFSEETAREQLSDKVEQWVEASGLAPAVQPETRAFRIDDWGQIKRVVQA